MVKNNIIEFIDRSSDIGVYILIKRPIAMGQIECCWINSKLSAIYSKKKQFWFDIVCDLMKNLYLPVEHFIELYKLEAITKNLLTIISFLLI